MTPFALFDLAEAIGRWVMWAIMNVINGLVEALGAVLAGISSVFPELPDTPGPPADAGGAVGVISWLFPWGGLLAILSMAVAIWLAILGIRVVARWVKLL